MEASQLALPPELVFQVDSMALLSEMDQDLWFSGASLP